MRMIGSALLILFLSVHPVLAGETDDLFARWQGLEAVQDYPKLFTDILNPRSQGASAAGMEFLKSRVLNGAVHAGYYTSYAQLLWAQRDKDNAAIMAGAALLILQTDRARCADKTAGQTRITNTTTALREPLLYWRSLPVDKQNQLFATVFAFEDKIAQRAPDRSLCASGMDGMAQAVKLMEEGKIKAGPAQAGNNIALSPNHPDVRVTYIADAEWQTARAAIRTGFQGYILGRP